MYIWWGGGEALLTTPPPVDDQANAFDNKHVASPVVRSLRILAAVGAFAISAATANSLALHPPEDHSGGKDAVKAFTNQGPPLGALRREPQSHRVNGDLLGPFTVALDNTYPLQATNRREFLRRMPLGTSRATGDLLHANTDAVSSGKNAGPPYSSLKRQPRASHVDGDLLGAFQVVGSTEVPQQATNRKPWQLDPPRSYRSGANGDLLGAFAVAPAAEVPQQGTNARPLRRDPPKQPSGYTGNLLASDTGIEWLRASSNAAPQSEFRSPPSGYIGDLLSPEVVLDDGIAWRPASNAQPVGIVQGRKSPTPTSFYSGDLLSPEPIPPIPPEPPVPPPAIPPDLGLYATDGRRAAVNRSRYFRPDSAYRYRRGR
jgi:hypothetical protein